MINVKNMAKNQGITAVDAQTFSVGVGDVLKDFFRLDVYLLEMGSPRKNLKRKPI
jgi:hypothetical protein